MDAGSSERRKSAVVAIVGDEPAFAPALARSLRGKGMIVIALTLDQLAKDPPWHDLALLVGDLALDGGDAALARVPPSKLGVVLRDVALAERLAAHRRGLRVVLRKESADAMAADVEKTLDATGAAELGWTSLASILDLLTRSIGARLSVDASARTELLLGDPSAVAEAIERCADELGMLAFQSRAGEGRPTVAVDELNWDDDPQTAQQSADEMARWRKLSSRPPPAEPTVPPTSLRFLRPLPRDAAPRIGLAPFEPLSAPSTDLAEILEPDGGAGPPSTASSSVHEEMTPPAAVLPAVLDPELAGGAPVAVAVAAPAPRSSAPLLAIGAVAALLVLIGIGGGLAMYWLRSTPAPPSAPRVQSSPPLPVLAPDPEPPVPAPIADDAPPPEDAASVDELVERGAESERANAWDAARRAYEAALEIEPLNPHALAGLARERLQAGDAEGAIRYAERAVSIRRRRAAYRVLLGDAHRAASHPALARQHYEEALEIDPDDGTARARLGNRAE